MAAVQRGQEKILSNIKYVKGNLFELAPARSYLPHACNCQGVWGAGIAIEFRKRFPKACAEYVRVCMSYESEVNIGTAYQCSDSIICLFTSEDYGKNSDSKKDILKNTERSLDDFFKYRNEGISTIHMPKINSGLFRVPWEETEEILKKFDGKLSFVVYEL